MNLVDILFLVTVVLLVFSGLRNGALFSLIQLLGLPLGFAVASIFGPRFIALLASNGLPATPLIGYAVLFVGTILIVHIVGNMIRSTVKHIPLISQGDTLLGGVVGFVEAWLIWLILLFVLGSFLSTAQTAIENGSAIFQGINLNINLGQFQQWHDFYNQAVTNSLFAKVNGLFITVLPAIKVLHPLN